MEAQAETDNVLHPVDVALLHALALCVTLAHVVADRDAQSVELMEPVVVSELVCVKLLVKQVESDGEADEDTLELMLPETVTDTLEEGETLGDAVTLRLPEELAQDEGLCVAQPEPVADAHAETERDPETLPLALCVGEMDDDEETLLLLLPLTEIDCVAEGDALCESDALELTLAV